MAGARQRAQQIVAAAAWLCLCGLAGAAPAESLRGKVVSSSDGRAVAGALVTLTLPEGTPGPAATSVFTNDAGEFRLPVGDRELPAAATLTARSLGYRQVSREGDATRAVGALTASLFLEPAADIASDVPASAWLARAPAGDAKNMDMYGLVVVPYDTDPLTIHLQANHAVNIIDFPVIPESTLGSLRPSTNLGDIDQFGVVVMSTLKKVGPGNLNLFASGALDKTHPNSNTVVLDTPLGPVNTGAGLMYTGAKDSTTGNAIYLGARYDLPSKTMLGFEYNHGSKNWISFVPAADDIWTSKLGTRGNVYEVYLIQELPAPFSPTMRNRSSESAISTTTSITPAPTTG
jgi:hypothetical protein